MSTPDVIIVGGGIGGLSTALALARQGLEVRVFEAASRFGEVGAGLQLAPNCTRILHSYGLLDTARSLGVSPNAMVMRDAVDGAELTRLDLRDAEQRYGFPYMVIHRSDLHTLFLDACRAAGVDLVTEARVTDYRSSADAATVTFADGHTETAPVVVAADGLHSVARDMFVGDAPVSSAYVAYRGTVPIDKIGARTVDLTEVGVYVGPHCHFVHYGLRGGQLLNQVAVFESPKALRGDEEWGTPDELDTAFHGLDAFITQGLPYMWRDKWWRMFDRDPVDRWVYGRVSLLGDAAHPPLQYIAQGAIMAIEDGWVLGQQVARRAGRGSSGSPVDWDEVLRAYNAVRAVHSKRVLTTSRKWGQLWHLDGVRRQQRNVLLRNRDTYDYSFIDWLYAVTALTPDGEPQMFTPISLSSAGAPVAR